MRIIFELGDQQAKEGSWKDFPLLKLCLCAMGIVIGTKAAPKHKETIAGISMAVFIVTYIPLMTKVFKIILRERSEARASAEN